jgi:hypothetical protein
MDRRNKGMIKPLQVVTVALGILLCFAAGTAAGFDPERVDFKVRFRDEVTQYKVTGVFMVPGEELRVEAVGLEGDVLFTTSGRARAAEQVRENVWLWHAPDETGLYPLIITDKTTGQAITLNIFVMVPYDSLDGDYLNQYRVGRYPDRPLRGEAACVLPAGFIEVTEQTKDALVSPHFTLKQFICKQQALCERYVVLKERLILKLEAILERVNQAGYRADTFHIMSGYRTPYYNKVIGNVSHSRHLWGDAADIFIDEDRDGFMDDLNRDGKSDFRDAKLLERLIDDLCDESRHERFAGGLASYGTTSSHGPFVHVDARGYNARWGG